MVYCCKDFLNKTAAQTGKLQGRQAGSLARYTSLASHTCAKDAVPEDP